MNNCILINSITFLKLLIDLVSMEFNGAIKNGSIKQIGTLTLQKLQKEQLRIFTFLMKDMRKCLILF